MMNHLDLFGFKIPEIPGRSGGPTPPEPGYYIKNTGNDANDGLTPDTAWETIAKVNAATFNPGDIIHFNKGDTWRENLIVPSSGNSGNYITFGSYGAGNKPQIFGSNQALNFADQGGNVWKSPTVLIDPYGFASAYDAEIWFIELGGDITWGVHQANVGALAAEYDWTWVANEIYVYAANDPDTRYASVEVPQRFGGIILNNKEYLTIDGLEVAFPRARCINTNTFADGFPDSDLHGLIIRNCKAHHSGIKDGGGYGFAVNHSDMLIRNNDVYENGRRNISLHTYGINFTTSNIIIENNHLHDGWHSTGGNGTISSGPGTINNHLNNIIFRRNLVEEDPNRAIDGMPTTLCGFGNDNTVDGGVIDQIYIYDNIFKGVSGYAIRLYGVKSCEIYNNTFYGMNLVNTTNQMHIQVGKSDDGLEQSENINIKNNIFYQNVVDATNPASRSLSITATQTHTNIDADYNLYYATDAPTDIIVVSGVGAGQWDMSEWAVMKAATGYETNSPTPADPTFVSAVDYHLQLGSPAIGAGLNVGLATDYEGTPWNSPPSIGAYEYN